MSMKLELIKEKLYKNVEESLNVKITKNSFLSVLLNSISVSLKMVYDYTDYLIKQSFAYSTTDLKYLKLIAPQVDLYEGRQSEVYTRIESTNKDVKIEAGYLININGVDLILMEDTEITKNYIDIENIDSFHNELYKCYIKFKKPHYFVNDMTINIEKAEDDRFLDEYKITIIDDYTIRFDTNIYEKVDENPKNLEISHYSTIALFATVEKMKLEYSYLYNNIVKDDLTFTIVSIVQGANKDDLFSFRERYLHYIRNPQAYFNEQFIKVKTFEIFGLLIYYKLDNENIDFYVIDPFNTLLNYNASETKIRDLTNYLDMIKPIGVEKIQVFNIERREYDLELTLYNVNENIIKAIESNVNDLLFKKYNEVVTLEEIKYAIFQAGGYIKEIELSDTSGESQTEIKQEDFIANLIYRI